jgi:predicted lipoprotein with Yx(FWY)xxD motif
MKRIRTIKHCALWATLSIIVSLLSITSACSKANTSTTTTLSTTLTTSAAALTVNVSSNGSLGSFMVDMNGRTLYWTTMDAVGQSNVIGALLANWPVFYVTNIVVPPSLIASDFGSITRADGSMQTTYKGWPLYYYINDQTPGQTLGQGLKGGEWSAVNPANAAPALVLTTTTTTTTAQTTTTLPSGY